MIEYQIKEVDVCGHYLYILWMDEARGYGNLAKLQEMSIMLWAWKTPHFIATSH